MSTNVTKNSLFLLSILYFSLIPAESIAASKKEVNLIKTIKIGYEQKAGNTDKTAILSSGNIEFSKEKIARITPSFELTCNMV